MAYFLLLEDTVDATDKELTDASVWDADRLVVSTGSGECDVWERTGVLRSEPKLNDPIKEVTNVTA